MEVNQTLNEILGEISEQGVPAFVKSIKEITEITNQEDENVDIARLCDVIMKDPGMTTRIIRETNTAYNVRRGRTNTVSRAVVMLGVREVRNICLASEIVDGLLIEGAREEVVHELVRAFYSAVQARIIAIQKRDRYSEEVYMGALVKRLGRLAFWRSKSSKVEELANALKDSLEDPRDVEKKVLGFTLDELSELVIDNWELRNMLPDKDSTNKINENRHKQIELCSELATVSTTGFDSKISKKVLSKMSQELKIEDSALKLLVDRASKETIDTTISYGLEAANHAIPELITDEVLEEKRAKLLVQFKPKELNLKIKISYIEKIEGLILRKADIRLIIFEILNAMEEYIGFDRSLFCLVNDDRTMISARMANAPDKSLILKRFRFSLSENDNFFTQAYVSGNIKHYRSDLPEFNKLKSDDFLDLFGENEFLIAPIIIEDIFISCLYADLAISKREITKTHMSELSELTKLAIKAIGRKK